MIRAYRLYTGPDGNSHVVRGSVNGAKLVDAKSVEFKETPAHSTFDWHNDPTPQYVIQDWLGYTAQTFPGSKFIPPILGMFVFVYGGLVFIRGARGELARHEPGMMTLFSLGIMAALGTSVAGTFGVFDIDVWWELTSLITIMLLGHWLEMPAI